ASCTTFLGTFINLFMFSPFFQDSKRRLISRVESGPEGRTIVASDNRAVVRMSSVLEMTAVHTVYWQDKRNDPRDRVTGEVNSVSGRTAERETDTPNEDANQVGTEAGSGIPAGGLAEDSSHAEHEHEGTNDLADEVCRRVADRRAGGEDGQFQTRVLSNGPVR